jgi:hypothetical protein
MATPFQSNNLYLSQEFQFPQLYQTFICRLQEDLPLLFYKYESEKVSLLHSIDLKNKSHVLT